MTLAQWLLERDNIMLVSHVRPDGDTIGSALALKSALCRLGKQAFCCCGDNVPEDLLFLPGAKDIVPFEKAPFVPKAAFFVDVSVYDRSAVPLDKIEGMDMALLDHHGTNPGFGQVFEIHPEAAATAVPALDLIRKLGLSPTKEEALCLYAALSTDTGNFSFSNTDAQAFTAAASLAETGFDLADAARRLFSVRSERKTRLIGAALDSMVLVENGKIAYTVFSKAMLAKCGATHEDTSEIIDFLKEIEGVEVAFTAEEEENHTRFSLRSVQYVDVASIAKSIGGGGHPRAAGVTVYENVPQAVAIILEKCKNALQ